MGPEIVGRDVELASVGDFVAGVADGAAALVLHGEAGVGKTTLWEAGLALGQAGGLRVVRAQPVESETALSFSGLGDLLDPVLHDALGALPAGQQRVLSRALALDEVETARPDAHAVGVATLNALRALSEERALLVAVDDVQWLDAASSAALAYATRRLRDEHVGVLLARRASLESRLVTDLARSLPADRIRDVEVGPLEPAALHHVVHEQLGVVLPRPLLVEVHEVSGGNPFYAVEIVRMLQRTRSAVEAGQPLPLPESLHDLVHRRLLALPAESRDFLVAAAALSHARVELVEDATGVTRGSGLAPALDAGVVALDGDRIRFTHPLLAAGAYELANPLRRAELHARLAELVDDPESKARHLAAAVDRPDSMVASALEGAASQARARGAPRAAALLLDRARELTPATDSDAALRRAVDAAYLHYEAGDSPRAEEQLRDVIAGQPSGKRRARALMRLARVRSYEAQGDAIELFRRAIAEAEGSSEILAVAHEGVAACLFRLRERLDEAVEHAELALELALELGDEALAAEALGSKLLPETLLGRETAAATAERAVELQAAASEGRVLGQPLWMVGVYWWWTDALQRAHDVNVEMLRRAHDLGDESSAPYVLVLLGMVESALGELEAALTRAREGQDLAQQSGQPTLVAYHLALESLAEAQLGNAERARAAGERALALVPETGARPAELLAIWALGHLELSLGNPRAAVTVLAPGIEFSRREAFAEPAAVRFVVDHIEALIELGQGDEATVLLDWYQGHAERLSRASALAASMRCRGLLAASEGRLSDAIEAYEQALRWHERVELPLDRARTLLALGVAERRAKRRRKARGTLEEARAVFARIGAQLWAERARSELLRISGRAPAAGALTPAEERIAALVAEGKTNREVAAALFLSERTVEGHLSRVFGKLGVRSRTELARALALELSQGIEPSNSGDSPVSGTRSAP